VSYELSQRADGRIGIRVFVKPRAGKSRVCGVREGVLEVALAAPPVDGEANAELVKTLARTFGIAKSSVQLVSGERSRTKLLAVTGVTEDVLRQRLDAALRG
jgi:uncharacterized protein (TIGR00251 family)